MPLITLDAVSYQYPTAAQWALREISLAVEPGEVILVRGPSGSGKSTLLRCLNGLVPHSTGGRFAGTVTVAGLDTRTHPPRMLGARVGFVFQHPERQFILEDVEAELAFGLENLGLARPLMRKRIEEVIDQIGIQALRRRRIASLSGGERQRVAIAAVLAMHPQAIALDEPTSQLDPQAAEDVLQVVSRLVAELGMTTVVAEHRIERIAPFVDRVWSLHDGAVDDAAPQTAFRRGGARPPVVDLAARLGWNEVPLGLRDARPLAARLRGLLPRPPAVSAGAGPVVARLDSVDFSYNGRAALRGASLRLHSGEVAVLMGRNGSGKTTLLKMIAGLVRAQRGRVEATRSVALVPQDADSLLFAATVRDELQAGGHRELPPPFTEWGDRYPRDLSAGERQQVAIGALDAAAGIVLLDEPTRGLDPAVKRLIAEGLRRRAAAGSAVLVATHDVEWAARVADRVLMVADGEIYAEGPPREVLSDSLVFSTQVNKLLGPGWLLPEDVPMASQ